ncbi:hypothetical protein [Streptomyces sp. KR55]
MAGSAGIVVATHRGISTRTGDAIVREPGRARGIQAGALTPT